MKIIEKKFFAITLSVVVMLTFVILVSSCSMDNVTPGGDVGGVISPIEGENNGNENTGEESEDNNGSETSDNNHIHTYIPAESSNSTYNCTEGGIKAWVCSCGDSFTEIIEAPGHDLRQFEGKEATCEQSGYTAYEKCIRGECYYTTYQEIPALGHECSELADVLPTCTTEGLTNRFECIRTDCDYYTYTVVLAYGHVIEIVNGKAATCTEEGYYSYQKCTREGCDGNGIADPTVIESLGHDIINYDSKEPTCTEYGWREYSVCQRCDYSTYVKTEAKGHSYVNGYCLCGYSNLELHTHIWNDGVVTRSATCTIVGTRQYTCTDINCCDVYEVEIPALGHDIIEHEAKKPTCTSSGWYAYEECESCGYNTFSEDLALGHNYDNGVVTASPTCTHEGNRTYTCVRDNCDKTVVVEIEKLGHDWGNWYVFKESTCTSSGQEQRICFNDSTHVDNRTIERLRHKWSEYSIIKNPTCIEEGRKKRTCDNDTSHEEILSIPVIPHDIVPSTGICNYCKNLINNPLPIPTIISFDNYHVFWNAIDGADHYQITIIYCGREETLTTIDLSFDLKEYFNECNTLTVKLRAMSPEGSTTPNSNYYLESFSVEEGTIVNYEGIGKTVNLIENYYTDYGNETKSIFNPYTFNRLMAGDKVTLNCHKNDIVYSESISEYTNKISESITNKVSANISAGVDKIFKVTGGYSFELEETYQQKTYNQTQTVFYDAYYEYHGYQAGINGFNAPEILYSMLSNEFIEDVIALETGDITPELIINKYGTHVITAGIYGAKFNAHYELLSNKSSLEANNKVITQASITAGLEGIIKGINLGGNTQSNSKMTIEDFICMTNSDIRTVFEINAVGGSHIPPSITLSDFANISEDWSNSMLDESSYVLIDVPDGSLYFIWDFLGDEYSNAKEMLNDYFFARCDEQFDLLNSKINGMYKDFYTFDHKTGTLIFDFSLLQEPDTDTSSLKDVLYKDGKITIVNGVTGEIRIYPKFSGYDVNRVVFKGGYFTRESQQGQLIDSYFDGIYIVFDDDWPDDRRIEIEFESFAYQAPEGYVALDFSNVSCDNIEIKLTKNNVIVGGNGAKEGYIGKAAIDAIGKNIVLLGDGDVDIIAGTGAKGTKGSTPESVGDGEKGGIGGKGGIGIVAKSVLFLSNVDVEVIGGTGGKGGTGGNAKNKYWGSENVGGNGGSGGSGGVAISAELITVTENATVVAIGGNGGKGGTGGKRDTRYFDGVSGSGGIGGSGVFAISADIEIVGEITLTSGNDGSKGSKGGSWYSG